MDKLDKGRKSGAGERGREGKIAVPREIAYLEDLEADTARLRARFATEGGVVVNLMIQLEAVDEGVWKPVRRFDDHHGHPHIDILDRHGEEVGKHWLDCSRSEAVTRAVADLKLNWRQYVAEFREK